jgi:hypothetical protein
MKKIIIGKKIMEVISQDEYLRRRELPEPLFEDTCVENDGMVYPILKRCDGNPGLTDFGDILKYTKPVVNKENYRSDKIIDFSDCKDLGSFMEQQDKLKASEAAILTTKNKITNYPIAEDDTPELAGSKEVINSKNIDIESYKPRFGSDGNNILKIFKNPQIKTISFNRVKTVCRGMDVEAYLIFKDKPGAINPMGKEVLVKLTSTEEEE